MRFYIETYGCQMNVSDSEIVASILQNVGYEEAYVPELADVILLNSCAIRDKAEQSIRKRLQALHPLKKRRPQLRIALLGCMAERLKATLLEEEQLVDMVVGPDAYRSLPMLLVQCEDGQKAVNTLLSREETYADLCPMRLHSNGVTAFISIMRGCDNMCSFCVVPFTRGRERSRDPGSIVAEAERLFAEGYREVTLLGQNVDSYAWSKLTPNKARQQQLPAHEKTYFAELLSRVAQVHADLRVRFSTSHPKDMTDDVLHVMKQYENICKYVHLPAQSGSDAVLQRMNRGYDRATYLARIAAIRRILGPDCGLSTDIITGFCGETEEDHQDTLSLMEEVSYDMAYMFMYSERPNTLAARKYVDDVPVAVKKRRLQEVIAVQRRHALQRHAALLHSTHEVLIESFSKRSTEHLQGRSSTGKVVVFPKAGHKPGQYVQLCIVNYTSGTLIGEPLRTVVSA